MKLFFPQNLDKIPAEGNFLQRIFFSIESHLKFVLSFESEFGLVGDKKASTDKWISDKEENVSIA